MSPERDVYVQADFARFAPRNALDMLKQVPGFRVVDEEQGRGLGQASVNVLINGERVASKSERVSDVLGRISANRVERIEIVDGAQLGIPGLSGQVANVVASGGDITGRFEYRALWSPRYANASYGAGEVSVTGATPRLDWSAAFTHNASRNGSGGGEGAILSDNVGAVLERRTVLIHSNVDLPRISGRVKWDGPGSLIANFAANYSREYIDYSNDEYRELRTGANVFRDIDSRRRGHSYEIGGDVDVPFSLGRLKLIGLERVTATTGPGDSILVFGDGSPSTGIRQVREWNSGERIGRAEYRWELLGGNWQLDAEAAFNRLNQSAELFALNRSGDFVEIAFPGGTGGVIEDRYEVILSHSRSLGSELSLQVGAGGEYSKLAQTGPGGLVRTFWRPKGSVSVAWTPMPSLDVSLKLARTVGQLAFSDFLASVDLAQDNRNAGNVELVPQQAWEADMEIKKNLRAWGSATLRLYGRWIEDYIDIIPVAGGLESRGNVSGGARLYGAALNATVNLDPLGWKGAKITGNAVLEESILDDPLTFVGRPFSNHTYRNGEISLRYDVPEQHWVLGGGLNWNSKRPYVRLFETGRILDAPVHTFAFIEHKDVLGLTINLNVSNLTRSQGIFDRTVYAGLRDRSAVTFVERRRLDMATTLRLTVRGSF